MARLMLFYPGLTVSDYDQLSYDRRQNLIDCMKKWGSGESDA